MSSSGTAALLKDAANRIEDDPLVLSAEATFALAYSSIDSFSQLSAEARNGACELASTAVEQATRACKRALLALASDAELAQWRAVLMAATYLLSWLMGEAEKLQATASLAAAAAKPARGAGKGAKKAAADAWTWDAHREKSALRLLEV